jgi:lipopolysaccharide/colanic/teichoic acid biosynthesis glycosyltransferase
MNSASKRFFDSFFSTLGLLALSPLLVSISILVKCSDWGPVFFRQRRVGRHGKLFWLWKFRTMVVNAEKLGLPLTKDGDPRINRIGRFLRTTKLDELPQLWNVFKGEMSFVGPRPEVPRFVEQYTPEQREILAYKPGITDLATLVFRDEEVLLRNAKNLESFYVQYCIPRKVKLNRQYAGKANLLQDIWIILQTLCPYWLAVVSIYMVVLATSFWLSYLLRFEFSVPEWETKRANYFLVSFVSVKLFLLLLRKEFKGLMSYFSVPELQQITTALSLALLFQLGLWYLSSGVLAPARSIILIDFFVSIILVCSLRLSFRLMREQYLTKDSVEENKLLRVGIIGAGEVGAKLARELEANKFLGMRAEVFFDDNPHKWQKSLHNVPIVGMPECLLDGAWTDKLDRVIIAMPKASSERLRQLTNLLARTHLKCHTVPSLLQLATGKVQVANFCSTDLDDLEAQGDLSIKC